MVMIGPHREDVEQTGLYGKQVFTPTFGASTHPPCVHLPIFYNPSALCSSTRLRPLSKAKPPQRTDQRGSLMWNWGLFMQGFGGWGLKKHEVSCYGCTIDYQYDCESINLLHQYGIALCKAQFENMRVSPPNGLDVKTITVHFHLRYDY